MTERSELRLWFFGQHLRVVCDDPALLDALATIYSRQQASPRDDVSSARGSEVRIESADPAGPRVQVAGRTVRVPERRQLLHYAHLVLVNVAAAAADGLLVLHAGAVAKGDRAALLVAPSGSGKTTTTVAMVRRGWRFLSDDFAVIDDDGTVHPFPRRLNLTPESLRLLGLDLPERAVRVASPGRGEKWMIDVEDLWPGALGAPSAANALFVVMPRSRPGAAGAGSDGGVTDPDGVRWDLQLDHLPDGLVDAVSSIRGVTEVAVETAAAPASMRVAARRGSPVVAALDEILGRFDVAVLCASRQAPDVAEPSRRPAVEALRAPEAAQALAPHDLGLSGRRFLRGTEGHDVTSAFARVLALVGRLGGRTFRLWPGEIEATVDEIEAAAGLS